MKMKRFLCGACALVVLLVGCSNESSSGSSGQASAAESQEEVYGTVVSIVGNEITLELGTLASGGTAMPGGEGFDGEMPDMPDFNGEIPNGFDAESMEGTRPAIGGDGEMPDMGGFAGGMPDMGDFDGEMPDMSGFGGALPEGFDEGLLQGGMGGSGAQVQPTGETVTYVVAVDTPVTVSGNDAVTTFSKIAEGNTLRVTLYAGTETVAAIEIVG